MAAWGVEARVPFLDREFLDVAMGIDPADKMVTPERPIEKWVLREAFEGLLPDSILWRQKEQFSRRRRATAGSTPEGAAPSARSPTTR